MYKIKVTYDTGDSENQEEGLEEYLDIQFQNLDKAKLALKYIKEHYLLFMLCHKEYDISEKQKNYALKNAKEQPWCIKHKRPFYSLLLEDDNGKMVEETAFWCGYFESLVGADIEEEKDENLSFRI